MFGLYILDRNNNPVPCHDLEEWGEWMFGERAFPQRVVAKTNLGAVEVSTVFLGNDRRFGDGPPILFETMVFGELPQVRDGRQWQCSTWAEALELHAEVVRLCEQALAAN